MNQWVDLVVRVEGRLVKSISRSFAKAYVLSGGKDQTLIALNREVVLNKAKTWIMEHFPVSNKFHLKKIYKEVLRDSEVSVLLVSPYFLPKRWLIGSMHQAVLRGVKVEVLIPKSTNNFFIDRVNYFYIYKMSKLGVRFFLEPKMNHAKVLIIDEKEGMVGSNNLDNFSFEFNSEIGVFIKNTEVIRKLLKITSEWKGESVLFDPKLYKPSWIDYIVSPLIRLLFFL